MPRLLPLYCMDPRVREDDKLIGGARRRCSLVTGDFRVFRVPSGRAVQQGSGEVLSRRMFERPDRTFAGGFKRDVGCLSP
jgi:hypothetical protein